MIFSTSGNCISVSLYHCSLVSDSGLCFSDSNSVTTELVEILSNSEFRRLRHSRNCFEMFFINRYQSIRFAAEIKKKASIP